jgi:hypothetical protein
MTRTKWLRLQVRDLADVIRWAGRQDARQIDDFRHRVVHGHESVSFRLVPGYTIEVGTRDIVVICHVRPRFAAWRSLGRRAIRNAARMGSAMIGRFAEAAPRPVDAVPLPQRRSILPS